VVYSADPANTLSGYRFQNQSLLDAALTHRSAGRYNNERLEFLGDAILGFIIAESLYERFPQAEEGVLTRLRASLVKRETLAGIARELELGAMLRLGPGERKTGGWRRESILANTLEAVIGAIYLDSDIDACRAFILDLFRGKLESVKPDAVEKDPKTALQEALQEKRLPLPSYEVIAEEGEPHKRIFTVRCSIDCLSETVTAEGRSKRVAEQAAAKKALQLLQTELP
jgi:ribonuclease-3